MELSRRQALWLVAAALAVHNAEEAVTFPLYWPQVQSRLPEMAQRAAAGFDATSFRTGLVWATLLPLAVVLWATWRPDSSAARWSVLAVQAVVAVNVASHVVIAAALAHGYSPGLLSAVLINVPVSIYLFRRAARERWITARGWRALLPAALAIHGPGLVGLLLLSRRRH
jgi:hypothetical protein